MNPFFKFSLCDSKFIIRIRVLAYYYNAIIMPKKFNTDRGVF